MNFESLNWEALDRLRQGFLSGGAAQGPYWQSADDLAAYDATYAERIGWKWDAVLAELRRIGWRPAAGETVLDWGCGSGVAGRRVVDALGAETFSKLEVWDHAANARDFAAARARAAFPSLPVSAFVDAGQPIGLLVVSHVLNELDAEARQTLLGLIARASAVIWVEPGTHAVSRDLGALRADLLERFRVVAPCPHSVSCGVLAAGKERDWCHFFASPPPEIHADSDWVRFGQRAGIDLRSLPYAYLVLTRRDAADPAQTDDAARIIGRAEHFKGFVRLLSCEAAGVAELELQKRANGELFKQLKRDTSHPLYRWQKEGRRIVGATLVHAQGTETRPTT